MIQCPHCRSGVEVGPRQAGMTLACPECGGQFFVPAERFDPYYTWLGIPPEESAGGGPNLYRLLGLALYEANLSVIENAADRQMMHLRSFQSGARAADSQRLLNEVSAARIRLLDPAQKGAYDEQLRQALTPRAAAVAANAPAPVSVRPVRTQTASKPRPRQKSSIAPMVMAVVGAVMGLMMGAMVVFYLTGRDFLGLSGRARQLVQGEEAAAGPNAPGPREQPGPVLPTAKIVPKKDLPGVTTDGGKSGRDAERPDVRSHAERGNEVVDAPTKRPAVKPNAAPAPRPQPNANPLTDVPQAWQTPALISGEPATIFNLASEPADPLKVALHSGTANLPANSAIRAESDGQGRGWIVFHASDESSAAKTALAAIRREGPALTFAWMVPFAEAELRRQVANCLLEVGVANDSRMVQLRMPERSAPLVMNMQEDTQFMECDVADPPPQAKLYLKIRSLEGFASGAKLKGNVSTAPMLKSAVIEFADLPGAEIDLRLVKHPSTGKLAVRSEPIFREGSTRKFELTLPTLEKMRLSQEKARRNSQADLNEAQAGLANVQKSIKWMNDNPPKNAQEFSARGQQMVAARTAADRLSKLVANYTKQVAEANARLAAVPKMREFIDSLHQRASVKYVVCAVAGDKEVVLVDAASVVTSASAE